MHVLLHSVPPTLQQATADPHLRWRVLDTNSQASLGQCLVGSLLHSPGFWCTQGFVCALQESVSPVLCKFWGLYGGFNGDLLPEGILPYPGVLHPEPLPLQQLTTDPYLRRRHSVTILAQSLWGVWVLVHTRFV